MSDDLAYTACVLIWLGLGYLFIEIASRLKGWWR